MQPPQAGRHLLDAGNDAVDERHPEQDRGQDQRRQQGRGSRARVGLGQCEHGVGARLRGKHLYSQTRQ